MKRPALFLDRDGVINVDNGYVHQSEEFEFVQGVFELVATANTAGYLVVVVTNQAGIGRGYYSEMQFHLLTDWMKAQFLERGGKIDAVYFCPHHPEYGKGVYRQDCRCRKPAPGMLFSAERDLDINLSKSVLVGDSLKDIQAAQMAGIGKIFMFNENKMFGSGIANCKQVWGLESVVQYLTNIHNITKL